MTVEPSIYRSGDLLSPLAGNRHIDGAAPALRADEPLAPGDQRHLRAVALGPFRRVGVDPSDGKSDRRAQTRELSCRTSRGWAELGLTLVAFSGSPLPSAPADDRSLVEASGGIPFNFQFPAVRAEGTQLVS
jgi:hypothetical protein